jgi:hypothetical protein
LKNYHRWFYDKAMHCGNLACYGYYVRDGYFELLFCRLISFDLLWLVGLLLLDGYTDLWTPQKIPIQLALVRGKLVITTNLVGWHWLIWMFSVRSYIYCRSFLVCIDCSE